MSLTDNLVSYWKLDESSGNASDSVGSITLTNTNTVAYSAGKINNGADSGATNTNKMLEATACPLTDTEVAAGFTMNCWVYPKKVNGTFQMFAFFNANSSSGRRQAGIAMNASNKLAFQGFGQAGGFSMDLAGTTTLSQDTWYMGTVTYNGSTFTLYLNATSEGTLSATYANAFAQSAKMSILAQHGGFNYASGIVDELGIWSRVLTGAEITELYNGGAGNQYPFPSANTTNFFQFM